MINIINHDYYLFRNSKVTVLFGKINLNTG